MLFAFALLVGVLPASASSLDYVEVVSGGADPLDRLPMIVAVHGLGDRPENFSFLLSKFPGRARLIFPRAPEPHGEGFSWFPFRTAGTDDQEFALGVQIAAGRIVEFLRHIVKIKPTVGKPIITGFSQGGMLAFTVVGLHPAEVAAAAPVSGFFPDPLWPLPGDAKAKGRRRLPRVLAFHGARDQVVPVDPAEWSVEVLRDQGYDAALRTYPDVGHTIGAAMRADLMQFLSAAVADVLSGSAGGNQLRSQAPGAQDPGFRSSAEPLNEGPLYRESLQEDSLKDDPAQGDSLRDAAGRSGSLGERPGAGQGTLREETIELGPSERSPEPGFEEQDAAEPKSGKPSSRRPSSGEPASAPDAPAPGWASPPGASVEALPPMPAAQAPAAAEAGPAPRDSADYDRDPLSGEDDFYQGGAGYDSPDDAALRDAQDVEEYLEEELDFE